MQLFAIVAKVDAFTNNGREIVQSFLKQQLNQEMVEQYLKLFDEFLESHHQVAKKKDGTQKRTSVNSVKVLKICTQINSELTQPQKVVVLLRLLEFINASSAIADQELEFVTTVAETFNIEKDEFQKCMEFVQGKEAEVPNSPQTLVIDSDTNNKYDQAKHIFSEGISGQVRILSIESVNMYVLRYFGDSELLLNGQVMATDKIYVLNPGSSIRSSKVKPVYYSDIVSTFLSDTSKAKINFTVHNLEYKFKGGKLGLRGINFMEDSGKLIGIMGGSGAGKSTLLHVLNGSEIPSAGEVLINGINIHTEKNKIEGVIGHVSQDDLLIEELTVFQNLFYNAKLCFGNLKDHEITKMVIELLASLGLQETKDLKVGSPLEKTISGGQRKRLNIGLELIREPAVLFVDEPTSGLSSRDSENIMDLLKELSLKGKLVFVVIHQPSSDIFKMFDKLMILDVGGYPIYYGNPVDSVIYFKTLINHVKSNESECIECGNVNPEQVFNIIESKVLDEYGNLTYNRKVSPAEWSQYYREKLERKVEPALEHTEIPESSFKIPNKFNQFKVFITRDVLSKLTNKQYLSINLIEAPLLAFILAYLVRFYNTDISNKIGYIFRENENMPAYLFMSVVVALFIGLTVSAEEIIRDRKIQKRESFLNLSKASYLYSKIAIMFVLSAIQTFLFVIVGNMILDIKGMMPDYWLVLFTTSCFANMLGLNISASFNSAVTIYILIPFLLIPQLLLSGVIVKFNKLNPTITSESVVPVTGEVMTSRWAFEALAVNQFKSNKYMKVFYHDEKVKSVADYKKNYWIPKLKAKVDYCENNYKNPANEAEINDDLLLITSEINKELNFMKDIKVDLPIDLTAKTLTPATIDIIKDYLSKLNTYYVKRYNNASDEADKLVAARNTTPEDKEAFIKEKNEYENESLSDLVTNHNELNRIIEKDGQLIQQADPVYLDPVNSNNGRAHFYAPRKKLLGRYYDTYWFNLSVIWVMSLILAITLYYDVLKKIINFLEELGSRFSANKSA